MSKIAILNNPYNELTKEVALLLSFGPDTLELSIEPPEFTIEKVLQHKHLIAGKFTIGHAGNFSFAHEEPSVRKDAIAQYKLIIDVFHTLHISLASVHPDRGSKSCTREKVYEYNIAALNELVTYGKKKGVRIMVENQPPFPKAEDMIPIFAQVPGLYLLFDMAHAYCYGGQKNIAAFIDLFHTRILHVHVTDNDGKTDDHFFIGKGTLPFKKHLRYLSKNMMTDFTVSIESFRVKDSKGKIHIALEMERTKLTKDSIQKLRKMQTI